MPAPTAQRTLTVALAGNPNAGKTTLFNQLTGARQRVGNYPGVTVEWKEGQCRRGDLRLRVVDLPGTYSLSAYSEEERVARNYLLEERPDVVVDVLDASNLERNLYLTTELLELGRPLVVVLNMSDEAARHGTRIDIAALARLLGAPVVATVGHRGEGLAELLDAVVDVGFRPTDTAACNVDFGGPVEQEIARAERPRGARRSGARAPGHALARHQAAGEGPRLPGPDLLAPGDGRGDPAPWRTSPRASDDQPDVVMARHRYDFVAGLLRDTVKNARREGTTLSDRVDGVVMHPFWGLPIFAALMYAVFTLTFTLGNPPMTVIETVFGWLGQTVTDAAGPRPGRRRCSRCWWTASSAAWAA